MSDDLNLDHYISPPDLDDIDLYISDYYHEENLKVLYHYQNVINRIDIDELIYSENHDCPVVSLVQEILLDHLEFDGEDYVEFKRHEYKGRIVILVLCNHRRLARLHFLGFDIDYEN